MGLSIGVALCIAYSVGLLLSGIWGSFQVGILAVPWSGCGVLLLTGLFAAIAPKRFKLGLRPEQWCLLAGVSLLAMLYMAVRSPAASLNDISAYVERVQAIAPTHMVSGRVIDEPRLNRGLKGRFRMAVERLEIEDTAGEVTFQVPVTGNLYITAPLLQVTGLHAGQRITASGRLYLPQGAMNPNGFDFQAYLAGQDTFAGFVAADLHFATTTSWGLWRVRQRIVRTQVRALGSPLGQLVSAMALGRKAVDLPFNITDLFARVGLAHTIAASGFHVSLLLGTVLAVLQSRPSHIRLSVGLVVLAGYVTLTGLQASVVRAALMGVAALIGLATDRKVKPLGALLVAVTLMLLVNPIWIWDVGFQLSVAATFGLIVMVPTITQRLDWLPVTLASLIAVPMAATLWTLPLSLYHFNVISGISIGLNAIATPLITVVSLGGIGSSTLAMLSPFLGGWVSGIVLLYPTRLLLWLAQISSQLPGSTIAIGQISIWQLAGLYAVLLLGLRKAPSLALKWFLPAAFLSLILGPIGWHLLTQNQITVLAAGDELIWVMQDQGHTTLVNSGTEKTAFYTVKPFLQQAGVNQIERAIALPFDAEYPAGWQTLLRQTGSSALYGNASNSPLPDLATQYEPLQVGQTTTLPNLAIQPLGAENPILRLTTPEQSWLLLPELSLALQDHLAKAGSVLQSQVLVWNGEELSPNLINAVAPEVAIAYGYSLPEFVERALQQARVQVFWTARDGAVTWRDRAGFHSYLETKHRNPLPWG